MIPCGTFKGTRALKCEKPARLTLDGSRVSCLAALTPPPLAEMPLAFKF